MSEVINYDKHYQKKEYTVSSKREDGSISAITVEGKTLFKRTESSNQICYFYCANARKKNVKCEGQFRICLPIKNEAKAELMKEHNLACKNLSQSESVSDRSEDNNNDRKYGKRDSYTAKNDSNLLTTTSTKKVKKNTQNTLQSTTFSWLEGKENSCRLDSFMSLFTLLLHNKDDTFAIPIEGDKGVLFSEFIETAVRLNLKENFRAIESLWLSLISNGIERQQDYKKFGSPLPYFALFDQIFELRLSYKTSKKCLKCSSSQKETVKIFASLLEIKCKPENFIDMNIEAEINCLLEDKLSTCPACQSENCYVTSINVYNQPRYLFVVIDNCSQVKHVTEQLLDNIKPLKFREEMEFIGSLNWNPKESHFSVYIKDPALYDLNKCRYNLLKGWFSHDGKVSGGHLQPLAEGFIIERSKQEKPYILIYKIMESVV